MNRYHSGNIETLREHEVFVFGSNLAGIHGKGAALTARQWGAVLGQGTGMFGQTYAIPTKDEKIHTRSLVEIRKSVGVFLAFAEMHPELTFLVTRVGCGLAGHHDAAIAVMFQQHPGNLVFPPEWKPYLR